MSRLAWFPFYVDDWLGGTSALLPAELVAYLQALLKQWSSGDKQAIPDDPARLEMIIRGGDFSDAVREKFTSIEVNGKKYLRNERLAREWEKAKKEHQARVSGGKARAKKARQQAELDAELPAELGGVLPHNSQPTTHKQHEKPPSAASPPGKARPVDPLYEEFRKVFREKYDWDYDCKKGDFVQLAGLKKSHNGSLAERWPAAVRNYLATPQKTHTLADLVVNFASYQRSAGNQYGRPVIDAKTEREPGYSERQSAKIRAALGPVGLREAGDADAVGVERRLQAPSSGRGRTGFDSG